MENSKNISPSSDWQKPMGKLDACDARRSWNEADIPVRHANAVEGLRETATGPWKETYLEIRGMLGSGFLTALLGPRGTGKTQLAVCLLRTMAACRFSVKYVKAMDLFRRFRSTFHKDGPSEIQLVDEFSRYGLLVIDEAHERGNSEFEDRTLTNLIDRRYDRGVDTLLIGNQTPEAFAAAAGPSIVSRLHETGRCIVCNWQTYRKQKHGVIIPSPETPAAQAA